MLDLPFKTISKEELALTNLLCSKKSSFHWHDDIHVRVGFDKLIAIDGYELILIIEHREVIVHIQKEHLHNLLLNNLDIISFETLPNPIKIELLTTIIKSYQSMITDTLKSITIKSINNVSKSRSNKKYGFFSFFQHEKVITFWLKNEIEYFFKLLPIKENFNSSCIELPFSLCIGQTEITESELACLDIGDIIFFQYNYIENNQLSLFIAGKPFWRCHLNEHSLTILEMEVDKHMQPNKKSIQSLPISITFEIGEHVATIEELNQLQENYVFELNSPLDQPVKINANGKTIGIGELVKVTDHIGVRVVTLYNDQNDNFHSIYDDPNIADDNLNFDDINHSQNHDSQLPELTDDEIKMMNERID